MPGPELCLRRCVRRVKNKGSARGRIEYRQVCAASSGGAPRRDNHGEGNGGEGHAARLRHEEDCIDGSSVADCVESAREVLDIRLQRGELGRGALLDHPPEIHQLRAALLLHLGGDLNGPADEPTHLLEVLLHEAAGRHRRGPHTQAVWVHSALVAGDRVLVEHDGCGLAHDLRLVAIHALRAEVYQAEVVVGAAGDEVETMGL
mmetsp:Transcript_100113/g.321083  ORF Transcript_100113/g.321083 Transcript_100113/m.321083 type:complete len:204 (-) Transcript_100113:1133-1744(-)